MVKSTAPYNFIPFNKKVVERYKNFSEIPKHDKFEKETYTGEIKYKIVNETDLIVSDGKGKFFRNDEGDFTIPGASIRGMIRNNVLTLGLCSVEEEIENQKFLYRRFASKAPKLNKEYNLRLGAKQKIIGKDKFTILENIKAGYIKADADGTYYIIPAKEIKNKSYFRIKEDDLKEKAREIKNINYMHYGKGLNKFYEPYTKKITFNLDQNNRIVNIKEVGNKYNGVLLSSGAIYKKKSHYIINEIEGGEKFKIDKEDISAYKKYYVKDKKDRKNKDNVSNIFYGLPKVGEVKPCFYARYNGRTYFGYTPYLRLFYDNNVLDGLGEAHKIWSLDYNKAIFGWTEGKIKEAKSFKSRVSFNDAVIENKVSTNNEKMILGSPNATCVQLYLNQDEGRADKSYNGDFTLRGRKFYWLKEVVREKEVNEKIASKEESLNKGGVFKGKIKFNNLKKDELGLLLYALKLDKESCHSIGKGKPYGFGRIKIQDIKLEVIDIDLRYKDLFNEGYKEKNIDEFIDYYKEFVKENYGVNVESELGVKTLLEISKKIMKKEDTAYMDFNGFKEYISLDTALDLVKNKYKYNVINEKNNFKQEYRDNGKNKSYEKKQNFKGNKTKDRNRNKVNYNEGEIGNGFAALANYKFD